MAEHTTRRVRVSRAQVLAAQLVERLDREAGRVTDAAVAEIAARGRESGIVLPADSGAITSSEEQIAAEA